MIVLLSFFALGIVLGALLRGKEGLIRAFGWITEGLVCFLLFVLGTSIGTNKTVLNNLAGLGFDALILTIGAAAGSILAVYPAYIYFFRSPE